MGILVSLLGQFLPYIIGVLGVIAGYFFIKNKGKQEEREKQAVEIAKVQTKVTEAVSQDQQVDQKVAEKIEEIKIEHQPSEPSAPNKFRF